VNELEKPKEEKLPTTKEEIIKQVERFSQKVLDKYGKLIKCIVMMGSVAREEFKQTSDVDVFVVIDDTLQEITPELHEKIDEDLEKIAEEISERISVQPSYTLTEFTDYARVCHPIIYNFIKEGIAIYDTGFFLPWKRLLLAGRIPGTREAIESYMEGAPKKIMRAKTVKLLMLAEDCYYAILNTAQAVLMFMGLPPPVPSKAYDDVMEYLVKPGILEKEYAEWLKEIVEIRKKIEHKELQDVSGAFVDEWIEKSEKFINKMFGLLNALEIRKREKILERTHEVMQKAVATALKTLHRLPEETTQEELVKIIGMPLKDAFKKEFIDTKKIGSYYLDVWNKVEEMIKLVEEKKSEKVPAKEVYEMREYVRKLIHELAKVLKESEKKGSVSKN
jgi:predicted nucleotidyltransferase/uncharacterized protein (UPF0332 family)